MPAEGIRTLHVLSVSDTHGWVYGHAHQHDIGNYGLLVSYIEHMHNAAARDPSADVLAIDGEISSRGQAYQMLQMLGGDHL